MNNVLAKGLRKREQLLFKRDTTECVYLSLFVPHNIVRSCGYTQCATVSMGSEFRLEKTLEGRRMTGFEALPRTGVEGVRKSTWIQRREKKKVDL